jgi:hypothetical protein
MITKRPYQYTETENIEAGDKVLLDNSDATRNTKSFDTTKLVLTSTTVNGHALSSNITISATDVGAPTISSGSGAPSSTPAKIGDMYVDTVLKHTYVANGTSSSTDWIKQNGTYSLQMFTRDAISPSDSTTYYFSFVPCVWAGYDGAGQRRCYFPKAGNIKIANVSFFQSAGSNETSSIYLRINNTTNYLISDAFTNDSRITGVTNNNLDIPILENDYCEIKWVAPAWVTNPTGIYGSATILIDL